MFGNKKNIPEVDLGSSIIGEGMRITGTVIVAWQVFRGRKIEGTIECDSVHILPWRKFNGEMVRELVVANHVLAGIVGAEKVQLAKNVYVDAELCCGQIGKSKGAKIQASLTEGQIKNG